MLNIGLLAPGAGEYYVSEVASSAEDYYAGRGEAAGRWVGSLAVELGLGGAVDPDDFRAVLAGRDPSSGELLGFKRGSAARVPVSFGDGEFDVLQCAAALGVSGRYVRQLLAEGDRCRTAVADDQAMVEPESFLDGERRLVAGHRGSHRWLVSGVELDRFVRERNVKRFRPGYDVTLRPPKSVSVLWALGDDHVQGEVRAAHSAAVDEVVDYYERSVVAGVLEGRRRHADGLVAAAFDHRTSRAGDPLLHTHVVVANLTRVSGQVWRAVESTALFDHAKAAGFLYQAHLRHELTARLGVEFGHVHAGCAEIVGVPIGVLDVFSKRRIEIEDELAATGRSSARAAQVVTLDSRHAKDRDVDADTLVERWTTEAATVGFSPADVTACLGRSVSAPLTDVEADRLMGWLAGPDGVCAQASSFRRSDVIELISAAVGSRATAVRVQQLADRFVGDRALVVAVRADHQPVSPDQRGVVSPDQLVDKQRRSGRRGGGQRRWTTIEHASLETDLTGRCDTRVRGDRERVPVDVAELVVALRPELSAEQAEMVLSVLASERFVLAVEGRPGAGKTYATEAVVAAHVAAGVPVIGCAVSAAAAGELETQAGFARSAMGATTVAKLLSDVDRWGLLEGSCVIVDEASMISTRQLDRLTRHVHAAGGRVILIGDPDQHGSVDAGGVFAHLCHTRPAGERIALVENRRQDDHTDRLAIIDYRNGRIADAVDRLDRNDRVVRSATAGESFDAMVADWYADHRLGAADPMIAGPNSTRRALNDRARVLLAANGELTGTPLTVADREFQVGDLIVTRRNDRTLSGSDGFVKNGSTGQITHIDHDSRDLTVAFDVEGTVTLPGRYVAAGHVEHGYARTTYGVQGHTQRVARYHPTDVSSFEEGYVAITRGKQGSRLYIVDGTTTADVDTRESAAHDDREGEHHDLADVTAALQRRRARTMVIDTQADIATVAHLAATRTLRQLNVEQQQLSAQIAGAPADATTVIGETMTARDALRARQRAYQLTVESTGDVAAELQSIGERIGRLDRRLTAAEHQQDRRDQWVDDHAHHFGRDRQITAAIDAVEHAIRANPTSALPGPVVEALGREPADQTTRNVWTAAVEEVALHHQRHGIGPLSADGIEAIIGRCPTTRAARTSWEHTAQLVEQLDPPALHPDRDIDHDLGL